MQTEAINEALKLISSAIIDLEDPNIVAYNRAIAALKEAIDKLASST